MVENAAVIGFGAFSSYIPLSSVLHFGSERESGPKIDRLLNPSHGRLAYHNHASDALKSHFLWLCYVVSVLCAC